MMNMRACIVTLGLAGMMAMLPLHLASADQVGHASWYALHSRTASGEMMNPNAMTAAHRSLPFGTKVKVENLSNGRSVVVRINDRGPFVGGRIIDVSKAAAANLGMISSGTANVRVTPLGAGKTIVADKTEKKVIRGHMGSVAKSGATAKRQLATAGNTRKRVETRTAKSDGDNHGIFSGGLFKKKDTVVASE